LRPSELTRLVTFREENLDRALGPQGFCVYLINIGSQQPGLFQGIQPIVTLRLLRRYLVKGMKSLIMGMLTKHQGDSAEKKKRKKSSRAFRRLKPLREKSLS